MQRELETTAQFVRFGDDLWKLRDEMKKLSSKLIRAIVSKKPEQQEYTRQQLRVAEAKDPELVYMLELADKQMAKTEQDKKKHEERAQAARSCLPHFNLDGLWVGKYGQHGYELINVSVCTI